MSLLEQFAMSLQPKETVFDTINKEMDWRLNQEKGIADLMYRRSLAERAKVDAEGAKAEYEDYTLTREMNNEVKTYGLMGKLVDQSLDNNDIVNAMSHQRVMDPDIPADAVPTPLVKDGLEVMGWRSGSTGEEGVIGSGSTQAVIAHKNKEKERQQRLQDSIALTQSKPSSSSSLATPKITSSDLLRTETLLKGAKIQDSTWAGKMLGDDTTGLKDQLDSETYGMLRQDIASKVAAASAMFKAQNKPFDSSKLTRSLVEAASKYGVQNQGNALRNKAAYDPDGASNAMDMVVQIELNKGRLQALRKAAGGRLDDTTDEDLIVALLRQDAQLKAQ